MKPMRISGLLVLGLVGITAAMTVRSAGLRTFEVDATKSRAVIDVGKAGALGFAAGHTHEVIAPAVRGVIHVDSQDWSHSDVRLDMDATALKVTGKGEPPEDVPKVQEVMLSDQVLDVRQYPKIIFQSTSVAVQAHTATTMNLAVSGRLTLRNVTRPLTVPVNGQLEAGTLTATGRFLLKQTDYNIKPISVGGVVKVKDALTISFTIVARDRGVP